MNEARRQQRDEQHQTDAANLLRWISQHGFATREEILRHKAIHGVGTVGYLYRLEPVVQSILRRNYPGLGLVAYQHYEPVPSARDARHFWVITGSKAAMMDYLDMLVKQFTTRTLNAANKSFVEVLAHSDGIAGKRAELLHEHAEVTKVFKEQWDLTAREEGEDHVWSTTDVEAVRSHWVGKTGW